MTSAMAAAKAAVHIMRLRPEAFPGTAPQQYWQSFERHQKAALDAAARRRKKKNAKRDDGATEVVQSRYAVDPFSPRK